MSNIANKSIVVQFWSGVFAFLGRISFFDFLLRYVLFKFRGYLIVDIWVMGHLLLAGLTFYLSIGAFHAENFNTTINILIFYGTLRVFEILVYQINVLLFDKYRAAKKGIPYALKGYLRIVLLLLHNYMEILLWFAASYVVAAHQGWVHIGQVGLLTVLRESMLFMVTFGSSKITAVSTYGAVLVLMQSTVGIFMTVIILARFLSLLPKPKTMDDFENKDEK